MKMKKMQWMALLLALFLLPALTPAFSSAMASSAEDVCDECDDPSCDGDCEDECEDCGEDDCDGDCEEEAVVVFFDLNGGQWNNSRTIPDLELESGNRIPARFNQNLTRANFTFGGWFTCDRFRTRWNFNNRVEDDIELFARWVCTVRFNSQGGSSVASRTGVLPNSRIARPRSPTRKGFVFAGWYRESQCRRFWDFSKNRVAGNTTLHAGWIRIMGKGDVRAGQRVNLTIQGGDVKNVRWRIPNRNNATIAARGRNCTVAGVRRGTVKVTAVVTFNSRPGNITLTRNIRVT